MHDAPSKRSQRRAQLRQRTWRSPGGQHVIGDTPRPSSRNATPIRRSRRSQLMRQSGHYARVAMSLDYASEHLTAAVRSLATSEDQLAERLQTAWDEHVQMVWMQPCLTRQLLREFRDLWRNYTALSEDRQSTKLRPLTDDEAALAIESLISLANKVTVAAATPGEEQLGTLADLD